MKEVHTQKELEAAGSKWVFVAKGNFVARGSAHVDAIGSSHVRARDFAHVMARGFTHVEARGSAHVIAMDFAHVEASGSAHVIASGSVHVIASGSAHVVARDFVTITKKSTLVVLKIGKKVLVSEPNYPDNINDWAELKGIPIKNGKIQLWKTTRPDGTDFKTGRISYLNTTVALDWDSNKGIECGKGLHLSDSPSGARFFVSMNKEFRLCLVEVDIKDCVCYPGTPKYPMKLRVRKCKFIKEHPPMYFESDEL